MSNGHKTREEYAQEATARELLDELARRRKEALMSCSEAEIEHELTRRGVDRGGQYVPPKLVEK